MCTSESGGASLWTRAGSHPNGTSAGIDKHAEDPPTLLFALGPAIVVIGGPTSLSLKTATLNPRLLSQNALINRYGISSAGPDCVAMRLRRRVREYACANERGISRGSPG